MHRDKEAGAGVQWKDSDWSIQMPCGFKTLAYSCTTKTNAIEVGILALLMLF